MELIAQLDERVRRAWTRGEFHKLLALQEEIRSMRTSQEFRKVEALHDQLMREVLSKRRLEVACDLCQEPIEDDSEPLPVVPPEEWADHFAPIEQAFVAGKQREQHRLRASRLAIIQAKDPETGEFHYVVVDQRQRAQTDGDLELYIPRSYPSHPRTSTRPWGTPWRRPAGARPRGRRDRVHCLAHPLAPSDRKRISAKTSGPGAGDLRGCGPAAPVLTNQGGPGRRRQGGRPQGN